MYLNTYVLLKNVKKRKQEVTVGPLEAATSLSRAVMWNCRTLEFQSSIPLIAPGLCGGNRWRRRRRASCPGAWWRRRPERRSGGRRWGSDRVNTAHNSPTFSSSAVCSSSTSKSRYITRAHRKSVQRKWVRRKRVTSADKKIHCVCLYQSHYSRSQHLEVTNHAKMCHGLTWRMWDMI